MRRALLFQRFIAVLAVHVGCQFVLADVLERGPYLQIGTPSSVIVKWRTDVSTDSEVKYGPNPASLTMTALDVASTTEHEVLVSGLNADTTYFYSIGSSTVTLAGGDSNHYFVTSPPPGTAKPIRLWVIGDSGTANANARAVRDSYLSFLEADKTDLLLMLGDNAYNDGTDSEYQAAVFDMYPQILRTTVVWPTLGNHDGHTADSATESGPYYDIFTLPRAAEAGGVASGTEAYYSFDYSNIHFICLDSYDTDRSPGGAMMTWLTNDLNANTLPWVIAFWHHPPYSKGSHNSDTEGRLIDMRTNANPILESHGVDLVFGGHSHAYERSFLIDGHYGSSGTFNCDATLGGGNACGSGQEENDGLYEKPDLAGSANAGAVYTVAGSSGKISGGTFDHPAMFISMSVLGSVVLDVNDDRLDATFLDSTGNILDYYTVHKGSDSTAPQLTSAEAPDTASVDVVYSEPVEQTTAETTANYTLDGGATVSAAALGIERRSVVLTTSALSPGGTYTVTVNSVDDNAGNTIAANSQQQFVAPNTVEECFQDAVCPNAGYAGTTDAYLSQAGPGSNFGTSTTLLVDGDDPGGTGNDKASVIRWDVSSIPAGSTVESAQITFNITDPTTSLYELYQLVRMWDEGVVSWTAAAAGDNWQTAGAQGASDRNSIVLGELSVAATGIHTFALNTDGVAAVQSWVDSSATNQGIMIANSASGNGVDFSSREVGTATNRPKLTVAYTPPGAAPPEPPTGLSLDSKTDTEVAISWTAPAGGTPVTEYNVYRDGGGTPIVTTASTSYTDTGLDPDTAYSYEAKSVGPGGESVASNTLNVTTDPAPPPNSVRVDSITMQLGNNKKFRHALATVTVVDQDGVPFSAATVDAQYMIPAVSAVSGNTNGSGQTVLQSPDVHKSQSVEFHISITSVTAAGYTYDEAGSVTAACVNSAGESCGAPPPPDTDPPAPPTGLTATAGMLTVALDWNDNGEPDLAEYHVFRSESSPVCPDDVCPAPLAQLGTSSNYDDNSVVADITYYYLVTALDTSENESGVSNEASATPTAPSGETLGVQSVVVTVNPENGKRYRGTATVTVVSSDASAFTDATVIGIWNIPNSGPVNASGSTGSDGVATIVSPKVKAGTGDEFMFTVTDIQHPAYDFGSGGSGMATVP